MRVHKILLQSACAALAYGLTKAGFNIDPIVIWRTIGEVYDKDYKSVVKELVSMVPAHSTPMVFSKMVVRQLIDMFWPKNVKMTKSLQRQMVEQLLPVSKKFMLQKPINTRVVQIPVLVKALQKQ